jgi:hypothetical protein
MKGATTMTDPNSTPIADSPAPQEHSFRNGDLSANEAATMAEWTRDDLAKGKISPEKSNEIFNQLGTPLAERTDGRSDEEKELDKNFGAAAKPEDYRITYGKPGEDVEMGPELKAFDGNARTWLSAAGFSKEVGNSLINIVGKQAEHHATLTPQQREDFKERENDKLRALYKGQENLNAALDPVRQMLFEIEARRPGLLAFVKAHGDDALLITQLVNQAKIYHARKAANR